MKIKIFQKRVQPVVFSYSNLSMDSCMYIKWNQSFLRSFFLLPVFLTFFALGFSLRLLLWKSLHRGSWWWNCGRRKAGLLWQGWCWLRITATVHVLLSCIPVKLIRFQMIYWSKSVVTFFIWLLTEFLSFFQKLLMKFPYDFSRFLKF